MIPSYPRFAVAFLLLSSIFARGSEPAQTSGNSGSIAGAVLDPTGAVVPNATVTIHNPVSHFDRTATSDGGGNFSIPNVPFNPTT